MRYVSRAPLKAWECWSDDQRVSVPSITVEPTSGKPTGLLDAKGFEIWVEPGPMGFRFKDNG